jgi:putative membrane protein
MRVIRYALLGAIAICLIVVALANRADVTLNLLPAELAGVLGMGGSATLPLYIVIFASIAVGVMLGFVWEWVREHKHRAEAVAAKKQAARLEKDLKTVRTSETTGTAADDVLALIEKPH